MFYCATAVCESCAVCDNYFMSRPFAVHVHFCIVARSNDPASSICACLLIVLTVLVANHKWIKLFWHLRKEASLLFSSIFFILTFAIVCIIVGVVFVVIVVSKWSYFELFRLPNGKWYQFWLSHHLFQRVCQRISANGCLTNWMQSVRTLRRALHRINCSFGQIKSKSWWMNWTIARRHRSTRTREPIPLKNEQKAKRQKGNNLWLVKISCVNYNSNGIFNENSWVGAKCAESIQFWIEFSASSIPQNSDALFLCASNDEWPLRGRGAQIPRRVSP